MNKQSNKQIESESDDRKNRRDKKKAKRMSVSGKDVLKLVKIIRKKK